MNKEITQPILSEQEYSDALARIEFLMDLELTPELDEEFNELVDQIEVYEDRHFPIEKPDPIEAIKFRMDQSGLTRKDLEPIIGSRSKVSEVLSGKRELTLKMIRALNKHLKIPAEILIRNEGDLPEVPADFEFDRFPINEIVKRGWIKKIPDIKDKYEEIIQGLISQAGGWVAIPKPFLRQGRGLRMNENTDKYALLLWCIYVLGKARNIILTTTYKKGTITPHFLRELAKLSCFENGPLLAREKLANHGIALVVEKNLPKTYLDGAAFWTVDNTPVVGMTIRYDRIDNFWFCLLHELAHIGRHMPDGNGEVFIDDLDLRNLTKGQASKYEHEADQWAKEALIPSSLWNKHPIKNQPSEKNVLSLAEKASIHPAIVAGRIRHEKKNYKLLTQFMDRVNPEIFD